MKVGELSIEMMVNLAKLSKDIDQASKLIGGAMAGISGAVGIATKALGLFGIGVSTMSLAGLVRQSVDAADKLNDLSKSTGLSVEKLSGLQLASKQSGAELETTAKAINILTKGIGQNADKYAKIGITAKEPLEAFKQLADVFNSTEDVQKRNALAADALGRSWETVAPLLASGSKEIQAMVTRGQRLSGITTDMASKADEFNDQMELLKANTAGWAASLATNLLPTLIGLSGWMLKIIDHQTWLEQHATETANAMENFAKSLEGMPRADIERQVIETFRQVVAANKLIADTEALMKKPMDSSLFVAYGRELEDHKVKLADIKARYETLLAAINNTKTGTDELAESLWEVGDLGLPDDPAETVEAYAKAQEEAKQKVQDLINAQAAELAMLQMSNRERAIFEALTRAGASATGEQQQQIVNNTNALVDNAAAVSEQIKFAKILAEVETDLARAREEAAEKSAKAVKESAEKSAREMAKFRNSVSDAFADMMVSSDNFWDGLANTAERTFYKIMGDAAMSGFLNLLSGGEKGFNWGSVLDGAGTSGSIISTIMSMFGGAGSIGTSYNATSGFWQAPSMLSGGAGAAASGGGASGALASVPVAGWILAGIMNETNARKNGARDENDGDYLMDLIGGKVLEQDASKGWINKAFGSDKWGLGADFHAGADFATLDFSNAFKGIGNSSLARMLGVSPETLSSNAGFLVGNTPGANPGYLGEKRVFASGVEAQGFTRRGDPTATTEIMDLFGGADQVIVKLVEELGGTLKTNWAQGRDEKATDGSVGNFFGVGDNSDDIDSQVDSYVGQLVGHIQGIDEALLKSLQSAEGAEDVIGLLIAGLDEEKLQRKANAQAGSEALLKHYASQAQQLADAEELVTESFGAYNVVVPQTRQQLYDLIKSFDPLTESGMTAIEKLSGLTGAFDLMFESADAAAQATKEAALNAAAQQGQLVDKFSTEAQLLEQAGSTISGAFAQYGVVVPQTREQLLALVDTFDPLTKSGQTAIEKLTGLAGSFETVFTAADAITQTNIENAISALESQIQAMDDSFGDLAGAMREIDGVNKTLVDSWRDNKTELENLITGLAEAMGELPEPTALEKLQSTMATITSIVAGIGSLDDQIFGLRVGQGGQGAVDLLKQREKDLFAQLENGDDPAGIAQQLATTGIQRINLEASIKQKSLNDAAKDQYDLETDILKMSKEAREIRLDALQDEIDAAEKLQDATRKLKDYLAELSFGSLSALNPMDQLGAARSLFEDTLASARNGDAGAMANLSGNASSYLQEAQGVFGGATSQYAAIYEAVTSALGGVGGSMSNIELMQAQYDQLKLINETQASFEQIIIDTSGEQIDYLGDIREALTTRKDTEQEKADTLIDLTRSEIAELKLLNEKYDAQIRQETAKHTVLMDAINLLVNGTGDIARTNRDMADLV